MFWQMDRPDKANCTSGRQEPHGYQGLPKGSVRTGYEGNRGRSTGEFIPCSGLPGNFFYGWASIVRRLASTLSLSTSPE
jgi:hypothetical protein